MTHGFSRRALMLPLGASIGAAALRLPVPAIAAQLLTPRRRLEAIAGEAIAKRQTAGVALGVRQAGTLHHTAAGFANLETLTPARPETVFRIGSLTKQFTAAAIVLLKEQGRLGYEDNLARFVPKFPRGEGVTIRQLLTHTSGLHDFTHIKGFDDHEAREPLDTAQMISLIAGQPDLYDFEPGSAWRYSNSGYYMLGAVIETVTGQSLADALQSLLFRPLGLSSTAVDRDGEIVPGRASGYTRDARTPSGFRAADFASAGPPGAAGAVRSTVGNLMRWHEELWAGRVVSPAGLAEMTSPGRLANGSNAIGNARPGQDGYGFGLGMGVKAGRRWIGHNGAINGFSASIKTYPQEQLTLVVLTNTDGAADALLEALDRAFTPPRRAG